MKTAPQYSYRSTGGELVTRICNGSAEAFEQLFRLHYSNLHRFLWGYVKSTHIAEELVQEVFLKVWEYRKTLNSDENIKTYIYKIGRNKAIDYLRHQQVVQKWEEEKKALHSFSLVPKELDDKIHNKFLLGEIKKAIEELPEKRRLVFILSRYEDMSYKEIADVLEISVNTVETQISRALKLLREKFSSYL